MQGDTESVEKARSDPGESVEAKAGVEPSPFNLGKIVRFIVLVIVVGGIFVGLLYSGALPWPVLKQQVRPVVLSICGDGTVGGQEECESASDCPLGQACDTATCDCVSLPCGNGVLDPGEGCDPPGSHDGCGQYEVCNATCGCVPSPYCGNNWVDPGEDCEFLYCDADNCETSYGCTEPEWCNVITCQCEAVPKCGDGVINLGEQCDGDDEPCDDGMFCSNDCVCVSLSLRPEPGLTTDSEPELMTNCGNGTLDEGEQCDGSGAHCALTVAGAGDDWTCTAACTCVPPCDFDGVCEEGEHVGNCSEDCASCGDGFFSPAAGEDCDASAGVGCDVGSCDAACHCTEEPGGGGKECDPDACRTKCANQGCRDSRCEGNTCVCDC
jgi:hypothetical protein